MLKGIDGTGSNFTILCININKYFFLLCIPNENILDGSNIYLEIKFLFGFCSNSILNIPAILAHIDSMRERS